MENPQCDFVQEYRIGDKLDGVIKIAITPNDELISDKKAKYRDLVARVKAAYPEHDPSDVGKDLRLYWCDDCEEINLWTYWQGGGNLDAGNGRTAYVFALAHCGAMGTLNRNGKKSSDLGKQLEDWRKIKAYLA